jgi:RNA polymerase sigma-70 factor (ECF subfamily)
VPVNAAWVVPVNPAWVVPDRERMAADGRDAERAERWRLWMQAAQRGDGEAYGKLLEELVPFVRGVVRGKLGADPQVDDVTQEVLLSIHTARHTFQPHRSLLPWVRTIARNAVIDWLRKRQRLAARSSDVDADELASGAPDPGSQRISPAILRALDQLPDSQRQAVVLLKVEGLSIAEAAERAGITEGALKLRAHRGYRGLRDLLGRDLL